MSRHGDGTTASTLKDPFSAEKKSKRVKSSNEIFCECKPTKSETSKDWGKIESPFDWARRNPDNIARR
jgi:hypothetical protein